MSEPVTDEATSADRFRKVFADAMNVANEFNEQLYEQRNNGGIVTLDWAFASRACMFLSYCAGYSAGSAARERS